MGLNDERAPNVKRRRKRSWTTILLPLFGLILGGIAIAFAVVLAPPASDFIISQMDIAADADGQQTIELVTGFGIFLITIMLFAALFALFSPKPPKGVSEQALAKEKAEREREVERRRKMQRQMRAKMRKANKQQNR